jgi:hypothetical protein
MTAALVSTSIMLPLPLLPPTLLSVMLPPVMLPPVMLPPRLRPLTLSIPVMLQVLLPALPLRQAP